MNRTITTKQIGWGYATASATLCFGVYLGTKIGRYDVLKSFYFLALLIVTNFTFALSKLQGRPTNDDQGFHPWNFVRSLIMSGLVWMGILFASAPVVLIVWSFAHN